MCLQHAGVGTDPVKWKWNCSRCWWESPNQLEESCRSCVHHGLGYVHYSNWCGCASNWCGCASSRMAHLYIQGMHVQSWMITQWTPPAVLDTPHYACYSELLHCTYRQLIAHFVLTGSRAVKWYSWAVSVTRDRVKGDGPAWACFACAR